MKIRTFVRLWAGVMLLIPAAGCQNLTAFKPPSMGLNSLSTPSSTPRTEENAHNQRQLPAKDSAEVSFTLAESLAANGHDTDAIIHYERCRQFDPHRTGIAARLAVLYGRVGKQKEALAEFEKAIKENPKDASLFNNMGYCHYTMARWNEAEQCYRQALALDSLHAHAWVNLGMALGMQKRYAESFEAFSKAVNPAEAHANLGFIYYSQGQTELARTEYRQALQLNPGMQKAQAILTMMDGKQEKPKLATTPRHPSGDISFIPPLPSRTTP